MSARSTTTSAPRRRARRGEGDRLRDEILEATAELLAEQGRADKVSTRAVAQRVGCSSPALYLHFPDKATLVYAVCEMQFRQLASLIEAAVDGIDDPVGVLRRAAQTYARYAIEHPVQYRIMMLDDESGGDFRRSAEELGAEAGMTVVVDALRTGMATGALAPADPVLTAVTLWAAVHGLVCLHLAKPGIALPPIEELIDRTVDVCVEGLRPRP